MTVYALLFADAYLIRKLRSKIKPTLPGEFIPGIVTNDAVDP